jgi:hypothetical protein
VLQEARYLFGLGLGDPHELEGLPERPLLARYGLSGGEALVSQPDPPVGQVLDVALLG